MDIQEQAALIAEYLVLARSLTEDSPKEAYDRANQLAWQLAVWLPAEVYREIGLAIMHNSVVHNLYTAIILARRILTSDEELSADEIMVHAPGIGKETKKPVEKVQ